MKLEEIEIAGSVDDYVRDCMCHGTTLMKSIMAKIDLSNMIKYTYWTNDVRYYALNDFGNSLKMQHVHQITTDWVIKKIQGFIKSNEQAISVFEERIIDSKDPHLSASNPYFTSEIDLYEGKEVYYYVDQKYCTPAMIESILNLSGRAGPFSSTALMILPKTLDIKPGTRVSRQELNILSSNVKHLVFGAFDLDGYIICSSGSRLG